MLCHESAAVKVSGDDFAVVNFSIVSTFRLQNKGYTYNILAIISYSLILRHLQLSQFKLVVVPGDHPSFHRLHCGLMLRLFHRQHFAII